jgi:hypothetical protein
MAIFFSVWLPSLFSLQSGVLQEEEEEEEK